MQYVCESGEDDVCGMGFNDYPLLTYAAMQGLTGLMADVRLTP